MNDTICVYLYVYVYLSTVIFIMLYGQTSTSERLYINLTIVIKKGNNTQFNTSFQSQMCNIDK